MSLEQVRTKIRATVSDGITGSGVDLSALSQEKRSQLAESISDRVLLSVNEFLDDFAAPGMRDEDVKTTGDEQILWQGRPFLSLNERYVVTNERIKVIHGMIGRDTENFELIRVQDIDVTQSPGERILNLGDINIVGADRSTPSVVLRNIPDPQTVYELLRKAWLTARKNYGLMFREEM